jgi:hypothetical protein
LVIEISFSFFSLVTPAACDEIAKCRASLHRYPLHNIIFLDETHLRVNEAPRTTLVAPGEKPYVIVEDDTHYAKRFDMIAATSYEHVLPARIYSPGDRRDRGVKGITRTMLIQFLDDILAQAIGALAHYPLVLVIDKASIHLNKEVIIQAFRNRRIEDLKDVIIMPTQAAKRMSPLDNSMFHAWKEKCRHHPLITERNIEQIMNDSWNNLPSSTIQHCYHHCLLSRDSNPYADCPVPNVHKHGRAARKR